MVRKNIFAAMAQGENALRVADNLYGFKPREGRSPAELWKAFGRSIPFLDKHLRNTAYLLASAIRNEDEIGAERYRDCLLRWLDTLRPEMQTDILLSHHALLTPDLFALDWGRRRNAAPGLSQASVAGIAAARSGVRHYFARLLR